MKRYINSNPKILGGEPVIVGTRVPVSVIKFLYENGYTIDQLDSMYPWVGKTKLIAVIKETNKTLPPQSNGQKILQT